ncbi:GIY-YIG nuclease family protein [Corynebacterium sanguinis]|uniref:GIY-YIG nuclease family protein n=1 Tax=Corynebacterium sanguinis TaxID=2594913 RepID=UPI00223C3147|nr:GIY-YIG nuclease family protein [Corynebacterium sanguinis]MCT1464586.1 GIY-YIG nuclease family protein [Corynebacterium sanguinis]MCT1555357.1 GIY-YIG nuclease family protein [Corynebacterium sanguinis]MCT1585763.1 GIY-YIG nuclease family protein [Corynebacterium sanguinis]MCT1663814.1 GIY-YIG nuclease family protein [Corynebacterium sanguinis]MCT2024340.1 GIY-YIG nuclease family protein [Corynebacterium sanguinis]
MSDPLLDQLDALIASDTDGLLDEPTKPAPVTEVDRLHRAFHEIEEFYAANGREPDPNTMDIAERKFGARLVGIRASAEKKAALADADEHGLLAEPAAPASLDDLLSTGDADLLGDPSGILDTSTLPVARKRPADDGDRAVRVKAKEFEKFAALFTAKHAELASGAWKLTAFTGEGSIREGRFFVVGGVLAFVAEVFEPNREKGEKKPRLRVIFENGTESSMYRESLANRLYETNGQAVTRATMDASEIGDADVETGHIYVLRSLSTDPDIASLSDLHKIGFSTTPVAQRIKGAEKSPTYLMAPVEVVADYRVYNLRPSALEHLLHRVFASVRLDASVVDGIGGNAAATEWFIVPLRVIDQAIDLIMSGEIVDYVYEPAVGELARR